MKSNEKWMSAPNKVKIQDCQKKASELASKLSKIKVTNKMTQPSLKQLDARNIADKNKPLKLTVRTGELGSAVKKKLMLDAKSSLKVLQYDNRLEFTIKQNMVDGSKFSTSTCGYKDCLKCRYTTRSTSDGHRVMHFSQYDTIVVCGAIHSTLC